MDHLRRPNRLVLGNHWQSLAAVRYQGQMSMEIDKDCRARLCSNGIGIVAPNRVADSNSYWELFLQQHALTWSQLVQQRHVSFHLAGIDYRRLLIGFSVQRRWRDGGATRSKESLSVVHAGIQGKRPKDGHP